MSDFDELDYYELLGIPREASSDEVKRAYRREIAKYHPDRFAGASPEDQAYAVLRAQRINEAYRVLADFSERTQYNRTRGAGQQRAARTTPPPPAQRDHQAELYEQARAHLDADRPLQAIAALRQLQRINPLYRDSADLMAEARARVGGAPDSAAAAPRLPARRAMLIGGGIGAVALAAGLAWALGRAPGSAAGTRAAGATPVAEAPTAAPTDVPTEAPTAAPTDVPTAAPTDAPTDVPTDTPTATPSATATPAPSATPAGTLAVSERFSARGWPQLRGRGWSVGYDGQRYRITADAGVGIIWSYRTGPGGDASYRVDAQVSGEAGLLLRFLDENDYLTFSITPQSGGFRVVQLRGGAEEVLAEGSSDTIRSGADDLNQVEARLVRGRLDLLANGTLLATVPLSDVPDSPRYGLIAVGGDRDSAALFDNLEIRSLEP